MRSVPPWQGKDDDTPVPPRVKIRVFETRLGRCHRCSRKIIPPGDRWTIEHLVAIANGGKNAEPNLGLTCSNCLPAKNAEDVAEKSAVAKTRKKQLGLIAKRPWPKRKDPWGREWAARKATTT